MTLLYAPESYWTLSEEKKKKICNKCGPQNSLLAGIIPNHFYGLDISQACDVHDYMWSIAAPTIEAKDEADRVFLNNLLRIVNENTKWNWLKYLRRRRARIYYEAVSHFGGPAFWKGKNKPENLRET